jgi:hypothetical protein
MPVYVEVPGSIADRLAMRDDGDLCTEVSSRATVALEHDEIQSIIRGGDSSLLGVLAQRQRETTSNRERAAGEEKQNETPGESFYRALGYSDQRMPQR